MQPSPAGLSTVRWPGLGEKFRLTGSASAAHVLLRLGAWKLKWASQLAKHRQHASIVLLGDSRTSQELRVSVQVRAHQVNSQLQAPQRVHRAWPGSLIAMQIPRPRAWNALLERTPARKGHRTPRAYPVQLIG